MSFWVADNKVPIEQTSIRIPSENGLDYIAGQQVHITIPENIDFFNPKETYLEAKVKINFGSGNKPTLLSLDAETGGQVLIRTLRYYSNDGTLLSEIDNYNTMVAIKYDYQTSESLRNKRALTEGCGYEDNATAGTQGTTKTIANSYINSPYFEPKADPETSTMTSASFLDAKICLPLHNGIFGNDKIFPNGLIGGSKLVALLEENSRVFRGMDGAMLYRSPFQNPVFHSINGCETTGALATNGSTNVLFTYQANSQLDATASPFCVGETIGLWNSATATPVAWKSASGVPTISRIETISNIVGNASVLVKYTLSASVEADGSGAGTDGTIYLYSSAVEQTTSYSPTYTLKDVNLIVQQVNMGQQYKNEMMRKMKEGGVLRYDFLDVTNYKYSQLASDRVANIRIPANNSRAKSVLCVPTDATFYSTQQNLFASGTYTEKPVGNATDYYSQSNRSGLVGIGDNLTDYQFIYDGRLQPARKVNVSKTTSGESISAQHLIELEKALSQAGMTAHSFRKFNTNFIVGRALSLAGGVTDMRNKDFNLMVNYETSAPNKNHLWMLFVYHIRTLNIRNGGVDLEV